MSKERELLQRIVDYADEYLEIDMEFIPEIQELLAQPEQQPEAWIIVNRDTGYRIQVSYFPDLYNKDMFEVIPLYTAPPKNRGRITDEEIYNHCCAMDGSYTCNFIDGVEWAEQQHGIGVDDE